MAIEVTTKQTKDVLTGSERIILHDPDAADKCSVCSVEALVKNTPSAFSFTPVTDAQLSSAYTHATIVVSNINVLIRARATGALSFSVNGGPFVTEDFVENGDEIVCQMVSSPSSSTAVTGTLALGSVSDVWSITTGNFWAPEEDSELVASGFFQEDLPAGTVNTWLSRGRKAKSATGVAMKLTNQAGVRFAKGTQQRLSFGTETDAPWLYRWWLVIAKPTQGAVTNADVPILAINGASGGQIHRQPYVRFDVRSPTPFFRSYLDNSQALFTQSGTMEDAAWNIMVCHRRGGYYHARINGVANAPQYFTGMKANTDNAQCYIGTNNVPDTTMPIDVDIDCILLGMGELHDALIDKLEGWAAWRVGRADLLPANHPYKSAAPAPDGSEGVISRYTFDAAKQTEWDTWAAISTATKTANIGNSPPSLDDGQGNDYRVVFKTDFNVSTDRPVNDLATSPTLPHPSSPWFAPTHLIGIGVDAQAVEEHITPNCYILNTANEGTLTLRLQESAPGNGAWLTGAFSSINKEGQGRTWTKGRFRMRAKFPLLAAPRPGFFPAFWSYGKEHLFWRGRNRLEHDFMEYDGLDGSFVNTTMHIHTAVNGVQFSDLPVRQPPDLQDKIIGLQLDSDNNFTPPVDIYDGEYHTWEFRIEDDFSYIIVDDKEVARVPTKDWLTVPKYIMVDWALRAAQGAPTASQTYDMIIDWIEVQQRERDLDDVPTGFSGRPTLAGTRGIGNTITLTPNTSATQVEIRWYKNGEPIVGAHGTTFVDDADSVTKALSANVIAKSLLNQPQAWTAELSA